jgi:hypothetical protein
MIEDGPCLFSLATCTVVQTERGRMVMEPVLDATEMGVICARSQFNEEKAHGIRLAAIDW